MAVSHSCSHPPPLFRSSWHSPKWGPRASYEACGNITCLAAWYPLSPFCKYPLCKSYTDKNRPWYSLESMLLLPSDLQTGTCQVSSDSFIWGKKNTTTMQSAKPHFPLPCKSHFQQTLRPRARQLLATCFSVLPYRVTNTFPGTWLPLPFAAGGHLMHSGHNTLAWIQKYGLPVGLSWVGLGWAVGDSNALSLSGGWRR